MSRNRSSTSRTSRVRLIALGAVVVFAAACSGTSTNQTRGSITIAVSIDPRGLLPNGTVTQELYAPSQIVEKLVDFAPDGKSLVPRLATGWKQLDDTTLRFSLRQGVKFTNGEAFNATSANYSMGLMLASQTYAYIDYMIAGTQIVDDKTIDITTKYPSGLVLDALAIGSYQYPKAYFEKVGQSGFNTAPVGSGPYVFVNWTRGESITLKANESYWGGAPSIKAVKFQVITDSAAQVAALRSHQVDLVPGVPLGSFQTVEQTPGVSLVTTSGNRVFGLMFSERGNTPLRDVAVRKALLHAVDVKSLITNQMAGKATALQGQLAGSNFVGFDSALQPFKYDPQQAKQGLAAAGYPNGLSLEFVYPNGRYPQDAELGQAISQQLALAGVTAKQRPLEGGAFLTALNAGQFKDMYLAGYLVAPDAQILYQNVLASTSHPSYWSDPGFDAILNQASRTVDPAQRAALLKQATDFLYDQAPFVPLFAANDVYAISNRVHGFQPYNSQYLNIARLTVD